MKIYLKFDFNTICRKVLEDRLNDKNIKYRILSFGEVEFLDQISKEEQKALFGELNEYGIEIIENQKSALVQKIKDTIVDMVFSERDVNVKASVYLAEKLNHSYGYLSNLFSEVTYTSIENFIILQKIEHSKQLIVNDKLTLTEIAYRLNYSSVAHLSTQFKNTTGITPSQFQKIISKRREIANKK
ncbi:AraC family transcriptional regulator [Chryseobacterium lacus]|uniref:AraC family transcriptional regulator n=1 Tax=Chryseobacterium lacus TaxID=2058346 RepID=A0A368MY52_9FLAO|nr:AraC family transcriptional regulator [Chryseobacterium lacus]ODS89286.1 MAG: AraC family transcriptional regulator [Chryseobacterium sp. SCN 40-13]RCU42946.1 AraC family transcriptional regulator [Chryseobacterium lacus]RST27798.1 AraC family transcriptional regulator [Chryseobacterium lacus]